MIVTFTVRGLPVPQGSSKAFVVGGRARITSASKGLPAWRNAIATAAASAMGEQPVMAGPLGLRVSFFLPRPKGHTGKRGLLPSAPKSPAGRPDLDKLIRACGDALTGVVWTDDAQLVWIAAGKEYGTQPGAFVMVEEVP